MRKYLLAVITLSLLIPTGISTSNAAVKAGNGGLIQFFPEHLEVAKKYRSTTRLLRKD